MGWKRKVGLDHRGFDEEICCRDAELVFKIKVASFFFSHALPEARQADVLLVYQVNSALHVSPIPISLD